MTLPRLSVTKIADLLFAAEGLSARYEHPMTVESSDMVFLLMEIQEARKLLAECGTNTVNPDTCGVCGLHFHECEVERVHRLPVSEQDFGLRGPAHELADRSMVEARRKIGTGPSANHHEDLSGARATVPRGGL